MTDFCSTERPRTPPRSNEVGVEGSNPSFEESIRQLEKRSEYFGHITDLIYPIKKARSSTTWKLPPAYCEAEAVDSSVLLGQGASFSASLQRLPAAADRTGSSDVGAVKGTTSNPSAPRPKFVVYKTARIAFGADGQPLPEYRRAMRSVITELHSLIYPSLLKHPNVIDFLGMAWGSNPFSTFQRLPAIVVEYAEHGTLADLLAKNPDLPPTQQQFLTLDIAQGLSALHQTGLIHGDVKAENTLICSHPDRQYIAKIADFGFSIVQEANSAQIYMGGTRPWMAPEVLKGPVSVQFLPQTDIFSLGLLCWVIFLGGLSPVDCIKRSENGSQTAYFEEIKADGLLLQAALDLKGWLERFAHIKYDQVVDRAIDDDLTRYESTAGNSKSNTEQMQKNRPSLQAKTFHQKFFALFKSRFLPRLLKVFKSSLPHEPVERKMEAVIVELKLNLPSFDNAEQEKGNLTAVAPEALAIHGSDSKSVVSASPQLNESARVNSVDTSEISGNHLRANATTVEESDILPITWKEQGFMYNWLSWQKIKALAPSIQNFVYDSFTEHHAAKLFLLSALHMVGYGCSKNSEKSLEYLRKAAEMGSLNARSNLFRIHSVFLPKSTDPKTIPGREYLYDYAARGSRMAMVELCRVADQDEQERCRRYVTDVTGGVGADWLARDQMLNGFTQSQWIKDDWSMKEISQAESPASLILNKRGDTILHFTAMCGRWKPFKALVETYKVDINIQNSSGETPTLAACRSGHGGIVILCLKNYNANASLAAVNGETPLHWLCSFDNQYIEPVAADIIARGADVEAVTLERVMHSYYPSALDMDFMLPGTPLQWAVHHNRPHIVRVLLKHGANPYHTAPKGVQSPLRWAAYWHHHQCLRIMIEHQETKVTQMTTEGKPDLRTAVAFGPLVESAINGADKYSMILRHGVEWLDSLHKTLDLLREKTVLKNFSSYFHGSELYFAVEGAHDEVIDYMFHHEWLTKTINKPIGEVKRTPFLEAVRWNRRPLCELLRDRGADVKALAANPFQPGKENYSALHILAHEGHDKDVSLAEWLIENGVPVDGRRGLHGTNVDVGISSLTLDDLKAGIYSCETAFAVAVRHNALNLANELLRLGANPNTLSFSAGMFSSSHPLTILGHLIVSNARHSIPRLQYLLNLSKPCDFIVEPERKLTALHRAAMAYVDTSRAETGELVKKEEFNFETNAEIMCELLLKWKDSKGLNAKCLINGNTAIHLAVISCNFGVVEALLHAGADWEILNDEHISAGKLAREMAVDDGSFKDIANAFVQS